MSAGTSGASASSANSSAGIVRGVLRVASGLVIAALSFLIVQRQTFEQRAGADHLGHGVDVFLQLAVALDEWRDGADALVRRARAAQLVGAAQVRRLARGQQMHRA